MNPSIKSNPSNQSKLRGGALLSFTLAVAAGSLACATTTRTPLRAWPPPPDAPRIVEVRSIRSEFDVKRSLLKRIWSALVPTTPVVVKSPFGLAFSPDEKILYIACGSQCGIVALDRANDTLRSFIKDAKKVPGRSHGIATDSGGDVYVSDAVDDSVSVFSPHGEFLRKLKDPHLKDPSALAIDRKGQILYVVAGASATRDPHRIEAFSLQGAHLRTIGKTGTALGQFFFPNAIRVTPEGTLQIVDMLNGRVQILSPEGAPLGSFGSYGSGLPGVLDKPKGIAADASGNLFVTDALQGVHVFLGSNLQPLNLFGQGLIAAPNVIAIDSKNTIFVGELANRTVHELRIVSPIGAEDAYTLERPKSGTAPAEDAPAPAGQGAAPQPASQPQPAPQ